MGREEMISGDDEENIVGAILQRFGAQAMQQRGFRAPGRGQTVGPPRFSAAQIANQVGGGKDNKLRAPLGLGNFTFTDAGPTNHNFIVEPQEAFRGERLIVDFSSETAGVLFSIDEILVGSLPQMPSTEFGLPSIMFRADATEAQMDWQICPAGTKIIVRTSLVGTLGEGDTAVAQLGIYGEWVRG